MWSAWPSNTPKSGNPCPKCAEKEPLFAQPPATPEQQAFQTRIHEATLTAMNEIASRRNEFARAFLDETGLLPSEAVMVEQMSGHKVLIWFENKQAQKGGK